VKEVGPAWPGKASREGRASGPGFKLRAAGEQAW
jgi:hypothetical protein